MFFAFWSFLLVLLCVDSSLPDIYLPSFSKLASASISLSGPLISSSMCCSPHVPLSGGLFLMTPAQSVRTSSLLLRLFRVLNTDLERSMAFIKSYRKYYSTCMGWISFCMWLELEACSPPHPPPHLSTYASAKLILHVPLRKKKFFTMARGKALFHNVWIAESFC